MPRVGRVWLGALLVLACTAPRPVVQDVAEAPSSAETELQVGAAPATVDDAALAPFGSPAPTHPSQEVRLVFWLDADGALGSQPRDEPHLIAYADGRVVFRRERESWFDWYQVRLDPEEVDALVSEVTKTGLRATDAMSWCLPGWWTLPMTRIAVRDENGWLMRQVAGVGICEIVEASAAKTSMQAMEAVADHYGFETSDEPGRVFVLNLPQVMYADDRERARHWPIRTSMPPAFAEAYRKLRDWSHPAASPFEPDGFELELYRADPGTNGGDAPWPSGLPKPPNPPKSTDIFRHRIAGEHYRYASPLEPSSNTMRPNLKFGRRLWQVFVRRDLPEQEFVSDTEAFANEVACAWDMRQRLQCTLDYPNMKEEWRTRCSEAMRSAAEVGQCQANRLVWMQDGCWETMYSRCGW